jgi:hypothetical protein
MSPTGGRHNCRGQRGALVIERAIAIIVTAALGAPTGAVADASASARGAHPAGRVRATATVGTSQTGVHFDPSASECAPYASVGTGSPYAYACPCSYGYPYGPTYESPYYYCVPAEATAAVPQPRAAAAAGQSGPYATTAAEPDSLPFTGANTLLISMLGAGLAGAGVLIRCRTGRR